MLDRGRGGTGLRASGPQQLRFYWGLSHQNRALIIASRKRGPSSRRQILLAERNGHHPDRNSGARSRMATYKTQMTPAPQEQHGIPVPSDSVERQKKQGIPTDGWWVRGKKAGILGGPFLPSEACWKWLTSSWGLHSLVLYCSALQQANRGSPFSFLPTRPFFSLRSLSESTSGRL